MLNYITTHWQGLALVFGLFVGGPVLFMLVPVLVMEAIERRRHYQSLRREVHALREENLRLVRDMKTLVLFR